MSASSLNIEERLLVSLSSDFFEPHGSDEGSVVNIWVDVRADCLDLIVF